MWSWVALGRTVAVMAAFVAGALRFQSRRQKRVWLASGVTALGAAAVSFPVYAGLPAVLLAYWLGAKRTRCIGLTGGIASGKSTAVDVFRSCGAVVVDADVIARRVLQPGTAAYAAIVGKFGRGILEADSDAIDRRQLRSMIMADAQARRFVNSVTHRFIALEMVSEIAINRWVLGKEVVVDAPLLFESGLFLRLLCSPIIVVSTPVHIQQARLVARDGVSEEEAARSIAAQMPLEHKIALADIVLENAGSMEQLRANAARAWQYVQKAPLFPIS